MNKKIVLDFIDAINSHDVDAICNLMSDKHRFIDSHGNEVIGKEKIGPAWLGYFNMFPDYLIEITDIFEKTETYKPSGKRSIRVLFSGEYKRYDFFVAFGFASGTYKGIKTGDNKNHFRLPASWKAIIEAGKIGLWQVYCDTKIPFDIINSFK